MGLFVIPEGDSHLSKLKACLSNLKLNKQVYGSSHLVDDFAIPLLEADIGELSSK